LRTDPNSALLAVDPKVLIEVLSDSTSSYDRGEKLEQYKQIDSAARFASGSLPSSS
jgi:Uma2 family endonuclease